MNSDDGHEPTPFRPAVNAATMYQQLDHLVAVRLALEALGEERLAPDEQRALAEIALGHLDALASTLATGWRSHETV